MILMGSGMGLLIEAWKVCNLVMLLHRLLNTAYQITKAVDISVIPSTGGALLPYKISIKGAHFCYICMYDQLTLSADKHVLSLLPALRDP